MKRSPIRLILFVFLLFSVEIACRAQTPPTHPLTIARTGQKLAAFHVEFAKTEAERSRGLMYRTDLTDQSGMLFFFETDTNAAFWMKNTPTSLDLIFIDATKRVVHIVEHAVPFSERPIGSPVSYRYTLEVKAGLASKFGIHVGDVLEW